MSLYRRLAALGLTGLRCFPQLVSVVPGSERIERYQQQDTRRTDAGGGRDVAPGGNCGRDRRHLFHCASLSLRGRHQAGLIADSADKRWLVHIEPWIGVSQGGRSAPKASPGNRLDGAMQMPARRARAALPLPPPRRACDVLCLRGRGLVVICSCSHCGLINTIRQAMAVSGVDKLHAVLGGFHLGVAPPDYVEHTRPRRGPGCCSPRGL